MNASFSQASQADNDPGGARLPDSDPHGYRRPTSLPGSPPAQLQSEKPPVENPQFKVPAKELETCEASLFFGDHDRRLPRLAFTIKETASMLCVSDTTVRRLLACQILRRLPHIRHVRIAGREILRFTKS